MKWLEKNAVLLLQGGNAALIAPARGFVMLGAADICSAGYPSQFVRQINVFGLYKAYELAIQQAGENVYKALLDRKNKNNQRPPTTDSSIARKN